MSDLKYHLEDSILLGYQHIAKIEEEYRNPPDNGLIALLDKWYRIIKEWEEQVKRGLPNTSRGMAFSQAKSSDISYESGKSVDVQNLIKNIRAKIQVLEEYRKEELQPASFILSGHQSRAYINSSDSSTNVIADQFSLVVNQLEAEFEKNYKGTDKKELLELTDELKTKQGDSKRAKEIIGTLLTRGAELAQIGSLIAQILSTLPK